MIQVKAILKDIVRAAAVLALFVFALTQAFPTAASPLPAYDNAPAQLTLASLCGGSDHADLSHSACHACRFDAVAIPAPPCVSERAFSTPVVVSYSEEPAARAVALNRPFAQSRAPPAI
ncbi:MAG TPA: hypothetical protein VGO70_07490 [Arsenicitalea sp.]|nr:hypothetical protein [Arsenicitalea sp.]